MIGKYKLTNKLTLIVLLLLTLLAACGETPTATPIATTSSAGVSVTSPATTAANPATTAAVTTAANPATASCSKLNLNTLNESQLMAAIPGFSNRMVREFLEYRPYVSIQQFRKEIGKYVEAKQVTDWEKYVFVPVKPNEADTETLKQIPGVTDAIATALIGGRPYASNDTFVKTLATKLDASQASSAACYLGA